MNPFKLLQKFLKMVRGGASPWQIAVSVMLGFIIGMTPGFNMTVVFALIAFMILNTNMALLLVGSAIGKVLCLVLAPITFEIGFFIIHGMGLEGLFRAASETPVIALMDLHYYCLIGGLPIAIVLGFVIGYSLGRTINKVRQAALAGKEKSEKAKKLAEKWYVKFLLKILFGKQKKTLQEMLEQKHPVLRKSGIIFCVVVVGLIVAADVLFADKLAGMGLKGGLEAAVGAEVNVKGVELSITQGSFGVEGLQITNPERPLFNMPEVHVAKSDISMAGLLAKRFVIDELVIQRVMTDSKRASEGEVFVKPERPEPPKVEDPMTDYFEEGKKVLEYLNKLRDYLDDRGEAQEQKEKGVDKKAIKEDAKNLGYLKLNAASVLAQRPAATIRKLSINEIPVGKDKWHIEGTDVSSAPELNENPMVLKITSDAGLKIGIKFDFTTPESEHSILAVIPNVKVGDAIKLTDKCPIDLSEAIVDVRAAGTFSRKRLNIPVELHIKEMKAAGKDGRGVLGLDAATSAKMFSKIKSLKVVLILEGTVGRPGIRIDMKQTLASLQESLKEAGAGMLADMAGGQMKKFGDQLPVKLPGGLLGGGDKKPGDGKQPGLLDGLLGGDKKEEEKKPEEEKKEEEKKPGLLDGLLK